jgi:hypothetical protein
MRPDKNGKGQTKGAKIGDGRGGSNGHDNRWKCTGFKDCCYYRFNTMDDAACYARGEPWGQGNPSRPTTAPTSNRFSALEAKGGGKGTGNGKQADEPWQTRAPTRRPLDDRGRPPKPIPVGKVDPWNKKPLPAKTGSGARVSAHEDHPLDAAPAPIGARRSAHEETRVGPSRGKGKHKANQPHEDEVPFDEEETIETD